MIGWEVSKRKVRGINLAIVASVFPGDSLEHCVCTLLLGTNAMRAGCLPEIRDARFVLDIIGRNSYYLGMKTTISEKGQITIPKAIRDKLGLRPGTIMDFDAIEGKLIGVKKERDDRIGKWLGKGPLPGGLAVDDYLRRVRG